MGQREFRVQLCTNFGRWRNLIRDEAIPLKTDIYPPRLSGSNQVYTLDPYTGQTVVGFTAFLSTEGGSFLSFGIQSQQLDTPSPSIPHGIPAITCTPSSTAKESHRAGSKVISFRGGSKVYTSAPLEGLKRIRLSQGAHGRPRMPEEISGLRLEYHDSEQPSEILGQWQSEFDSLDIVDGDEVRELKMWLTKRHLYFERKVWVGPVIRIDVITSSGSAGVFRASDEDLDGCTTVVFRANRIEKLDKFLWAYSSIADHPRILSSPISIGSTHHTPNFHFLEFNLEKYPWTVPETIFWEEISPDGTPDPLIRVSGYSRVVDTKYLIGLSFHYKSGAVKTLGDVDGQIGQSISLDLDDGIMISRIDLLRNFQSEIVGATFTTVTWAEHTLSETTLDSLEASTSTSTQLLPPLP